MVTIASMSTGSVMKRFFIEASNIYLKFEDERLQKWFLKCARPRTFYYKTKDRGRIKSVSVLTGRQTKSINLHDYIVTDGLAIWLKAPITATFCFN